MGGDHGKYTMIYLRDKDHVRAFDALLLQMSQEGNYLDSLAKTCNEQLAMVSRQRCDRLTHLIRQYTSDLLAP